MYYAALKQAHASAGVHCLLHRPLMKLSRSSNTLKPERIRRVPIDDAKTAFRIFVPLRTVHKSDSFPSEQRRMTSSVGNPERPQPTG
jgi:hypothetical protein